MSVFELEPENNVLEPVRDDVCICLLLALATVDHISAKTFTEIG